MVLGTVPSESHYVGEEKSMWSVFPMVREAHHSVGSAPFQAFLTVCHDFRSPRATCPALPICNFFVVPHTVTSLMLDLFFLPFYLLLVFLILVF